ncbi:hypothetical protein SteCoe_25899 [Stentor coeruleus]|uniref:Uncharacterized protein n=1 Tax=Stentor coeruleus TaxID=5963 RepID=A0A1R2BE52_9CILI|nr:hypothetical protein SteCoe_25899 [Stentor coeruleus]
MSEKWSTNIFNCFPVLPAFIISYCCPCIIQGISVLEVEGEGGCGECLMGMLCLSIGLSLNRNKLRDKFGIQGNCVADCLAYSCCCHCCLTTQEYIHAVRYTEKINK